MVACLGNQGSLADLGALALLEPPPPAAEGVSMAASRVVMHQIVLPSEVDALGICFGGQARAGLWYQVMFTHHLLVVISCRRASASAVRRVGPILPLHLSVSFLLPSAHFSPPALTVDAAGCFRAGHEPGMLLPCC
jgi:hypothetical protein